MNDQAKPPFDFSKRSTLSRAQLRAAPQDAIAQSLTAFCDKEAESTPDFDELMMVGLLLQENNPNQLCTHRRRLARKGSERQNARCSVRASLRPLAQERSCSCA